MTTPHPSIPKRFAPLAALLAQLRFSHEHADYREEPQWVVYAHPHVSHREETFDALIHIAPCTAELSTAQGLRLIVERGNTIWLPAGRTNRRGQIWFPALPFGSFSVRLVDVADADEAEPEQVHMPVALRGASFQVQRPAASLATPWVYYLEDRRVLALLEQETTGRAVLTVETEAPQLAEAVIHYVLGSEAGVLTLLANQAGDCWRNTVPLQQTFEVAYAHVPTFVIEPSHPCTKDACDDVR